MRSAIPHIVVFRTGGIGDVVLSTASLSSIFEALPLAQVCFVGKGASLDLIKDSFPLAYTIDLEKSKGYTSVVKQIQATFPQVDLVLDLQRSLRTLLLGKYLAVSFQCPYYTWNKRSLSRSISVLKARFRGRNTALPETEKQCHFPRYESMREVTEKALSIVFGARITRKMTPKLLDDLQNHRIEILAIAIGLGALHRAKEAPMKLFVELAKEIAATNKTVHFILVGDQACQKRALEFTNELSRYDSAIVCINKIGKTSLSELAVVLQACVLTITNDTAIGHLSEAVGTPIMAFFGPTVESFGYPPFLEKSFTMSSSLGCRPCTKDGNTQCRFGDYACFTSIDLSTAKRHLQENVYERV
jgi:ADP-heptose:LPS heptosyltransferase